MKLSFSIIIFALAIFESNAMSASRYLLVKLGNSGHGTNGGYGNGGYSGYGNGGNVGGGKSEGGYGGNSGYANIIESYGKGGGGRPQINGGEPSVEDTDRRNRYKGFRAAPIPRIGK